MRPLATAVGAVLLLANLGAASIGAETDGNPLRRIEAEPAAWQGPALTAQLVPPAARDSVATPTVTPPQTNAAPAETITPSSTAKQNETPLLDGKLPSEELMPPVVTEGCDEDGQHKGVQPYGGGHPTDWTWGCGGSPYRTGPGLCDNYKVGPRWHITVDGIVLHRDSTDLVALAAQMQVNDPTGITNVVGDPSFEQFDHGPGGRVTFTSQVGNCTCYDVQAVYEGVNDWNASIVFPKQTINNSALPIPAVTGTVTTTTNGVITQTGVNTEPGGPFPQEFEQRSLQYRSDLNSVELNFLPNHDSEWRPFFGVRYIRFDDEINDFLNQETQPPLAGPRTDNISPGPVPIAAPITVNDPIGPTYETDRSNLFHIQNNLMGFQVGLLHDTFQLNDRLAFEGVVNGGVYYNRIKYSNVMIVSTTQTFADNTRSTTFDDARTDVSTINNNDARDLSEISYEAEASLTGVCRLNRCWALRAGYQVLWLNHVHTADTAYLGDAEASQDLLFHGWHAGIECRR